MSDKEPRRTLQDLDARLREAEARHAPKPRDKTPGGASMSGGISLAFRMGVDLVAALVVGVASGYGLDYVLGSLPLFLIVGFVLGSAAGMVNVYRTVSGIGGGVGFRNADAQAPKDGAAGGKSEEANPKSGDRDLGNKG
jgi:ATP synthase protein I